MDRYKKLNPDDLPPQYSFAPTPTHTKMLQRKYKKESPKKIISEIDQRIYALLMVKFWDMKPTDAWLVRIGLTIDRLSQLRDAVRNGGHPFVPPKPEKTKK